jgi:nitrogen fixation NifU-like protein
MALYSKKIIEHFKHPRNVGKMKNPSEIGKAGNLLCGDVLWLYLKIIENKKKEKIIKKATFSSFGCIVAIANSSMITTMIKGKTLEEALKITKEDILKKLGKPLPPIKIHCSILALDALHEAIYDYYLRNKLPIPEKLQKEHERVQQTLKTIEERHKKYLELEKKVLEK